MLAGRLYRMFRFILATSLIAYLFYTEDILRFYFTPFYFLWYFLPLILKFTSHLEHVGMSSEDYATANNDDYYNQPKTNQDNSAINSHSIFDNKEEKDEKEEIRKEYAGYNSYAEYCYYSTHPQWNSTSSYSEEEADTISGF